VEGQKPKEWHGFKKDIQSVGDFIRLYTTRYGRWLSPKFLHMPSLAEIKRDLAEFIRGAMPE
jgi:carboxypeptidase C (cathepsin A)